jgi:PTH1 family peptidyl-tRNA hydrolase
MKLIVGFGNPGNMYNFTRHNTGFLALDFYAKINGIEWEKTDKFDAKFFRVKDTFFIKPQTFYNDVGKSIAGFKNFYKIKNEDILVICDDFNIDFGKIRLREKGSAGGNNGLKSTIEHLGTDSFPRLRVGTANDTLRKKIGDTDFVLGKFIDSEREKLPPILREICSKIDEFLS